MISKIINGLKLLKLPYILFLFQPIPKATTTTAPTTTISILGFEMMFDMEEEEFQVSEDDDDYVETDPAKIKV